ncbi:CDP-diacylglycerol--serine O-phosphatidyltransferase [Porticoccaceae bacterium]|nr:CDP-diacylglycerol--serine O-phosphatidyltransferase [Porticoccaceae bacterium]
MPARRKGIYLLPNLLTTGALFCGFYAVLSGFSGEYEWAAMAIFAAMIFDGLDGRVARMTNTQSDFGVQYDSLSDMVSFGVAPAVVAYGWGLTSLGKLGLAAAFVYASCAALRLARFNVQAELSDNKNFTGLPSPAAAAIVAGLVWSTYQMESSTTAAIIGAVITAVAGLLMVSNFKYPSFKEVDLRGKVPFMVILSVVMGFVVITIDPPRILFTLAIVFGFSAPLIWAWKKLTSLVANKAK